MVHTKFQGHWSIGLKKLKLLHKRLSIKTINNKVKASMTDFNFHIQKRTFDYCKTPVFSDY